MSKCRDAIRYAFERGYRVVDGKVISPSGKLRKTVLEKKGKGYLSFGVKFNGDVIPVMVHSLVAYEKFGEDSLIDGVVGRHRDGNSINNKHDNILIGTHKDNFDDNNNEILLIIKNASIAAGKAKRKLSITDLFQFKKDVECGMTLKYLTNKYGISKSTASYIRSGRTYKRA